MFVNLRSALLVMGSLVLGYAAPLLAAPPAPGHEVTEGFVAGACSEADFASGASAYSANFGYYFSKKSKQWIQSAWCYPVWGNLAASASQLVTAREAITIYATPNGGSNSAEYAPLTNSISWSFPGELVSGCGPADLACTFIPFPKKSKDWQWSAVQVSMPRTFFINSPGSNCVGRPICPGFTTNAWTFVGSPPCGEQAANSSVINVITKNRSYMPTSVLVEPGDTIRMCNEDPFPQKPYTPDNGNWGSKKVQPGTCVNYKIPKLAANRNRANIIFYDALHINMKLKVVVKKSQC